MNKKISGVIGSVVFLFFLLCVNTFSIAEDKYVAFLSLGDYTGPTANTTIPADMGCEDVFKYYNDKGGIDGVKVNFIGVDTRYEIARGVSAYKRLRKTPKLLVVNVPSTGMGKALSSLLDGDKMVSITVASGEFVAKPDRMFIWGQTYQDAFGAELDWIITDWTKKGNKGKPTVGYISWDNNYGREALLGGKEYAEKIGIKLLSPELFPMGTSDHTPYLTRLKDADYIHAGTPDPTSPTIIRDAHKLGMTKNVQFLCDTFGTTQSGGVKAYNEATQGTVVGSFFLRGDEAHNNAFAKELWTTYRKKPVEEMSPLYLMGATYGSNYIAGLKLALKEVGYEKLGPNDMYKAYQKLTGLDTSKGMQGPCAYGPTSRRGTDTLRFYRVEGNKLVPISGWVKCPDTVSLHKF